MAVPEPITRLEKYWAAILDKIQGGGSVTVEALNVTENDTYTAPTGKAYSPVTVAVPNPNSVVTVTGTVAEPFGSIDPAELRTAITSNNASVKLVVDASQIGYNDPIRLVGNNASAGNIYFEVIGKMNSTNGIKAVVVNYDFTGAFYDALVAENSVVTSLKQYASLLTTTLTVIYHPLPTE